MAQIGPPFSVSPQSQSSDTSSTRHSLAAIAKIGFAVVAILPGIPALWPALALDTVLGRVLYYTGLGVFGAAAYFTEVREKARERTDADAKHTELRTGQAEFKALLEERLPAAQAAVGPTGPVGYPLMTELKRLPIDFGVTGPLGPVARDLIAGVSAVLQKISQEPPTTPETVDDTIRELRHFYMPADSGQYGITGSPASLIHKDKDGHVRDEG